MNRERLMEIFNAAPSAVDLYESVLKALRFEKEKFFAAGSVYNPESIDRTLQTVLDQVEG